MERYRRGHNGADSKSVCRKRHAGSNPALSARKTYARVMSYMARAFFVLSNIPEKYHENVTICLSNRSAV